jgi:hypothetical protein
VLIIGNNYLLFAVIATGQSHKKAVALIAARTRLPECQATMELENRRYCYEENLYGCA